MAQESDERGPRPRKTAPRVATNIASVRRLTGCPGGHAATDPDCGLDAFIAERRRIRAESARRDREFVERDAYLRFWLTEILGRAA